MKKMILSLFIVLFAVIVTQAQNIYTVYNSGSTNSGCTYEVKCTVTYTPTSGVWGYTRWYSQTISPTQTAVFNIPNNRGFVISSVVFSVKTGSYTFNNLVMNSGEISNDGNCKTGLGQMTRWISYSSNYAEVLSDFFSYGRFESNLPIKKDTLPKRIPVKIKDTLPKRISNDQAEYTAVKIFPNPAVSEFSVETETAGSIMIIDVTGRTLLSMEIKEGATAVNIGDYPKGLYHVVFRSDNEMKTLNLIKQ